MNASGSHFEGSERLELLPALGRPTRQGTPTELSVSDGRRVIDAVREGRLEAAKRYLAYLQPQYLGIVVGSFEWALRWPAHLEQEHADRAADCLGRAWKSFRESLDADTHLRDHEATELLCRLLVPGEQPSLDELMSGVASLMQGHPPSSTHPVGRLLDAPNRLFGELMAELDAGAIERFETWQDACCARHDLLLAYTNACATAVAEQIGQASCEEALRTTFHECSFYAPMIQMLDALPPSELALGLAEHLRQHFTGKGRRGEVQITEEPDRFRLVFDPCGSGGAIRRRGQTGSLRVLPQASPSTWGRAGEVPPYCAHCAHNEVESIERRGFPLWVTEFDPDPAAPCGWTVFKDAAAIPDEYFVRVGKRRP